MQSLHSPSRAEWRYSSPTKAPLPTFYIWIAHPICFIERSSVFRLWHRVIQVLSSLQELHPLTPYPDAGLFRALVSAPLTAFDSQIPLVEHLAYLVSHTSPHSCKADYWRINMCSINILGLLCVQHSDALTLVGQPNQLLGNLVSVIHSDVTTLYQSIEERALPLLAIEYALISYAQDPKNVLTIRLHSIIRRIESAIRLLVFVCASPNAKINLRTKLQAISGIFPGIQQQFSLAFARLAYADPPDWLSPSEKNAIIEMEGKISLSVVEILPVTALTIGDRSCTGHARPCAFAGRAGFGKSCTVKETSLSC